MSKKQEFIELLKGMKETNVTYKQIAERLGVNINSLYTWIQKGNIGERRAVYLMKQIQRAVPDEYFYVVIINGAREVEKELREAMQAGNALA